MIEFVRFFLFLDDYYHGTKYILKEGFSFGRRKSEVVQ